MITIHHLNQSRSDRIIWLMEELGLPYELVRYERDKDIPRAPASLAAVHPLGKAPVITDDQGAMMESGAIVEYIIHRYGNGRLALMPDDEGYREYLQWFHFAEGSLMAALVLGMFLSGEIMPGLEPHVLGDAIKEEFNKPLGFIDAHLSRHSWFAGEQFSAADIMMGWALLSCQARGRLEGFAATEAYLQRLTARPAYCKAASVIAEGNPVNSF